MTDFLLRKIPDDLHRQWKFFAKNGGHSMRRYLLIALKRQVERNKDGGKSNGRSKKHVKGRSGSRVAQD